MANRWGDSGNSVKLFWRAPKSLHMVIAIMKLKHATPWKKSYDQPCQHIKSRDIILPIKVHLIKAIVFPIVIYGCESWPIKKDECWRIDAFELCCWRRLLGVPWIARRSNQSILKEISSEYSLEGMMLKLKPHTLATWCEDLPHFKRPWCWERLKVGGEGNDGGCDGWMASPTQRTWGETLGGGDGQGNLACCSPWGCKESDMTERLNWTENFIRIFLVSCH